MVYFRRLFWIDTAERVISTAAQAAVASISATALVQDLDWAVVGGTTALAALASLLKCLAAQKISDPDTPSLVDV